MEREEYHLVPGEPLKQKRDQCVPPFCHASQPFVPPAPRNTSSTCKLSTHAQYTLTTLGVGSSTGPNPHRGQHPAYGSPLGIHQESRQCSVFVRLGSEERRGSKRRWKDSENRQARAPWLPLPPGSLHLHLGHSSATPADHPSNFYLIGPSTNWLLDLVLPFSAPGKLSPRDSPTFTCLLSPDMPRGLAILGFLPCKASPAPCCYINPLCS